MCSGALIVCRVKSGVSLRMRLTVCSCVCVVRVCLFACLCVYVCTLLPCSWGCLLRNIDVASAKSKSSSPWCPCPVCFEPVGADSLRSYTEADIQAPSTELGASDVLRASAGASGGDTSGSGAGGRTIASGGEAAGGGAGAGAGSGGGAERKRNEAVSASGVAVRQVLADKASLSAIRKARNHAAGKRVMASTVSVVPPKPPVLRFVRCRRPKNTMLAMPATHGAATCSLSVVPRVGSPLARFSRVVEATPEYVQHLLEEEMMALRQCVSIAAEDEQYAAHQAQSLIQRAQNRALHDPVEVRDTLNYFSRLATSVGQTKSVLHAAMGRLRDRYVTLLTQRPTAVLPQLPHCSVDGDGGSPASVSPPRPSARLRAASRSSVPDAWDDPVAAGAGGVSGNTGDGPAASVPVAVGDDAAASATAPPAIVPPVVPHPDETAATLRVAPGRVFVPGKGLVAAQSPTDAPTPPPLPAPARSRVASVDSAGSNGAGATGDSGGGGGDGAKARRRPRDGSTVFYQLESGDRVFLHGLNMKALLAHHRSYDDLPPVLEVSRAVCGSCW